MHEFHPRPDESDENDGRSPNRSKGRRGPWATLKDARDAIRRLRAEGLIHGQVRLWIHPGIYRITEPLELGPEDSHTTFAAVEPGRAVIDGGLELRGWQKTRVHGRRAWVVDLPDVAKHRWFFRSLFVDGRRRPRARWPKFSPDPQGAGNTLRIAEIRFPERRGLFEGDHMFRVRPEDIGPWPSLPDSEVVVLHYWVDEHLGHPRYDEATGWITCERRTVFNLYESFRYEPARCYIDHLH